MSGVSVPDAVRSGLEACVGCGFCNATCPTYQLTGNELEGPRGRLRLMRTLADGGDLTQAVRTHLDHCLHCLACETTCPSGVGYGAVIDWARNAPLPGPGRSFKDRIARWLISRGLRVSGLRQSLMRINRLAGWVGFNPLGISRPRGGISHKALTVAQRSSKPQVLIAAGCVDSDFTPKTRAALGRVLDSLGIAWCDEAAIGCCGALDLHMGLTERAHDAVRANLSRWSPMVEEGLVAILVPASGCGATMKAYQALFAAGSLAGDQARQLASLIQDPIEFLESRIDGGTHQRRSERLVFQSPCTLQHAQRLGGRIEALLTRLGYEVLEDPDSSRCCGAAGAYAILEPNISQALLSSKCRDLESMKADAIVTANIGCQIHLQKATKLPVTHWLEWVDAVVTS